MRPVGIGKTALLERCIEQDHGCRVLRLSGIQSEMELPFAALHQLCTPVLAEIDAIPAPQENAAPGRAPASTLGPPDHFLVALATLSLIAQAALKRPLVVLSTMRNGSMPRPLRCSGSSDDGSLPRRCCCSLLSVNQRRTATSRACRS